MYSSLRGIISPIAQDNPRVAYVGAIASSATMITNHDGNKAMVRSLSAPQSLQIAANLGQQLAGQVYRVTVTRVSDHSNEPSANATYWISTDGGTTRKRCKFLNKQDKGSHWWIFLEEQGN